MDMVVKFLEVMLTKIDEEHKEFIYFVMKKKTQWANQSEHIGRWQNSRREILGCPIAALYQSKQCL